MARTLENLVEFTVFQHSIGLPETVAAPFRPTVAVIGVANALLREPLPGFPNLDELVAISSIRAHSDHYPFTLAEFLDYRRQTPTLDQVAAFGVTTASLRTERGSERLVGLTTSPNFLEMAGVGASLGRTLQAGDEESGGSRPILLSNKLWARVFSSRTDIVGKKIVLNGQDHLVIGVLPRAFSFPNSNPEFWQPLYTSCDPLRTSHVATNYLKLVGRLRPGVRIDQVRDDLNGIASRLRLDFPESNFEKPGVRVVPVRDQMLGEWRRNLAIALPRRS